MRPTTSRTPGPRWLVPRYPGAGPGQRVDGLGPDLGRPAAEPAVCGDEVGGDRNLGVGAHRCHHSTPGPESESVTDRNRQPSPRRGFPRRVAAIAESATLAIDAKAKALGRPGSTSSATAPANRTSRPPTTSSRRPSTAARNPASHRYTAGGLPDLCGRRSRPRPTATRATGWPPTRC